MSTNDNNKLIDKLITGHKDFQEIYFKNNTKLFREMAKSEEKPKYLVVGCADSQLDLSIITNSASTDFYHVKNVGGFIPPEDEEVIDISTLAAIEFALNQFAIKDLILLGHRHCQSVRGLVNSEHLGCHNDFTHAWFDYYQSAKDELNQAHMNLSLDEQCDIAERLCLLVSLKNLLTYPWITQRIQADELNIHAWYFDLDHGKLQFFNQETTEFDALINLTDSSNANGTDATQTQIQS